MVDRRHRTSNAVNCSHMIVDDGIFFFSENRYGQFNYYNCDDDDDGREGKGRGLSMTTSIAEFAEQQRLSEVRESEQSWTQQSKVESGWSSKLQLWMRKMPLRHSQQNPSETSFQIRVETCQ